MTPEQIIALKRVAGGDCHPRGHSVRCVRACVEYGYATLEDHGKPGHDDWYATITDKGREFLRQNP